MVDIIKLAFGCMSSKQYHNSKFEYWPKVQTNAVHTALSMISSIYHWYSPEHVNNLTRMKPISTFTMFPRTVAY